MSVEELCQERDSLLRELSQKDAHIVALQQVIQKLEHEKANPTVRYSSQYPTFRGKLDV
jgi:hypothetical protein